MASGGVGRLATKNTCSICLEPFKGRFPKLLPCFHTFCLPCLKQMVTRTVSQVGQTETIITCPNCRKDCVVPPGGVAELQKNFYLEQDDDNPGQGHLQPIICDLCDQGQVASHRCTRCQLMLCFHCHRGHSNCQIVVRANSERGDDASTDKNVEQLIQKGRDQMTVMERMLNKLAGDESELNRQRKKLEDALMRKVKLHADAEDDKIKKNKADLKTKLDVLSQLLSDVDPSSISASSLKSALLPDAELSTMRDKTSDEKQTDYFKALSGSLSLCSATEASHTSVAFDDSLLFGDGSPLALEASQLQQATRMNELAQKVESLMRQAHEQKTRVENKELIAEIRAMHDKNTILLQEVATVMGVVQALQTENGKLQNEFSSFKDESGKLQKDFSDFKDESGKLQKDFSDFKDENGKLQKDFSDFKDESGKLQKDFSDFKDESGKLQKDFSDFKDESGKFQKDMSVLQAQSGKLRDDVSDFKDESGKFQKDMSVVFSSFKVETGKLRKDMSVLEAQSGKLQNDFSSLKDESGKLQKDMSVLFSNFKVESGKLRKDLTVLQGGDQKKSGDGSLLCGNGSACESEIILLKTRVAKVETEKTDRKDFTRLRSKLENQVAFRASLSGNFRTKAERTLICKQVELNVGNGYNAETGKFRAPVSGTYLFCASVVPAFVDEEADAAVMTSAGFLFHCRSPEPEEPSTGQAVVNLSEGDEVWLETYKQDGERSSFGTDEKGTSIMGFLVRPHF